MMSILIQDLNILDGVKNSVKYTVKNVYTKAGSHLYKGKRVCELVCENKISIIVKAKFGGVVSKTSIKVGDDVYSGDALIEVKECLHPTILGNMCCDCGVVLEEKIEQYSENSKSENLVSMLHSIPDLKVSKEEAERVGYEDIKHLLDKRKLVLLVDLDQTLIHTTNDNIPPKLKDVFHFQLIANGPWYHTRLRPFTKTFLKNISKFYELHICTFGVREYAHFIANFLDPDRKLFGDRILSRNECLDPMSKKANLSSLFPCGDNLVCIIDDRSDVWNFAPNVVQVMPYHFFQHTGDINAPPELQKKENDNISVGFDFSNLEELTSVNEEKKRKSSEKVDENEQIDQEDVEKVTEAKTKDQSDIQEETEKGELDDIVSKVYLEEKSIEIEEKATNNEKETKEKDSDECEDYIKTNKSTKDSEECEDNIKTNKSEKDFDECEDDIKTNKSAEDRDECEDDIKTNKSSKDPDECEDVIKTNKSAENRDECEDDIKNKSSKDPDECEDGIKTNKSAEDPDECEDYIKTNKSAKDSDECEDDIKTNKSTDSETIDVEDNDDYLLYLEDNLKKLHKHFYEMYDYNSYISDNILPDLKDIVPNIRKTVLDGCHLVFSGIVPQNTNLTNSKVYHIATSLGATVSEKIIYQPKKENGHFGSDITTHVIAANLHTEKVHQAKKQKHIKIVTPNWLWCCAERWERVDERLFKLTDESEKTIIRNPPMHCFINLKKSSTELNLSSKSVCEEDTTSTTNTQENNIFKSVSPLAYMSNDETKSMNDEVDDVLQGEGEEDENQECINEERESSESEENSQTESSGRRAFNDNEEDDVDDDEFDDEEENGRRKKKRKRNPEDDDDYDDEEEDEEEELPSIRFRQGGSLPSDDSDDDTCDDDINTYGDILERELMRE